MNLQKDGIGDLRSSHPSLCHHHRHHYRHQLNDDEDEDDSFWDVEAEPPSAHPPHQYLQRDMGVGIPGFCAWAV